MSVPGNSDEDARTLEQRASLARGEWANYLAGLPGSPPDPLDTLDPLGGFHFPQKYHQRSLRALPELWSVLRQVHIEDALHSHGGQYFAADPCVYDNPPSWSLRRRFTDRRLHSTARALPRHIPEAPLDFSQWLTLISALDLLRTDICSGFWNELQLASSDRRRDSIVRIFGKVLRACWRTILNLTPCIEPWKGGHSGIDLSPLQPFIWPGGAAANPDKAVDVFPWSELDPDNWVRSRRASDNTFLAWSSLFTMARTADLPASPCWIISNGFGGIDLGFLVAEWLSAVGVPAFASVCHVGGHSNDRASHPDQIVWPAGAAEPRCILFCDDSISSGGTFHRFEQLCKRSYPHAEIQAFVLSYDLNPRWTQAPGAAERFRLAHLATARAPWSPSPYPKASSTRKAMQLITGMKSSSDEKLRWLGETQADIIAALNQRKQGIPSNAQDT